MTDEEQAKMDEYVEENKGRSSISLLLGEPGIIVTRKLKCCYCGEVFEARSGLWKDNEVSSPKASSQSAILGHPL